MKVFFNQTYTEPENLFVSESSYIERVRVLQGSGKLEVSLVTPSNQRKIIFGQVTGVGHSWVSDVTLWANTRPEDFESSFKKKYPNAEFKGDEEVFFHNMKTLLELVCPIKESQKL